MVQCTLSFKSDGPTVSLGGCDASSQHSFTAIHVITSFNSHSHIGDDKPRWRYEDVLQVHLCSQLLSPGVSRRIDVIYVRNLQTWSMFFFWKCFLFWNQISHFKGHVYSSLIVEMKLERCQFFKVFLEIKLCWSKIQHTLFNIVLWLSCILREKKNWLVVRLKWLFPWFFVSILNSNFGYIFRLSVMRWPFTRYPSQNLRLNQERLFLFLSTNFISMHNNQ